MSGERPLPWLAERRDELLPVSYFQIIFALPRELCALSLQNKRLLYDLLFRASAATLLERAGDPKHLGANIGFLECSTLERDRDAIFGLDFSDQVRDMGIEEVLSAPRSPWQRAYVERIIGSIRRE
jgi:hypothetical protein